ncbi:DUF1481 domain-containing protein [Klebsiella pneumoniae]|uniref:DUF1481 domain-containing protein n=1 Tax=Klebsiella pneumoniae TaxID=573 RepID=UPI00191DF51A|nr:DUF1481 domain-containing protein [Klebsiella pneumoniae]QQU38604.1 DUF1481 domain-containing protein [Klebsiella pneumoniae]
MAVNSFIEGAIKPLLSVWRRPLALAGILLLTACSHDTSLPAVYRQRICGQSGAMRIWRKDSGDEVIFSPPSPVRHGDTSTSEYRWQGDQLALIELNVYGKPPEHIRARFDAQGDLSFMQREVDGQKQQLSSDQVALIVIAPNRSARPATPPPGRVVLRQGRWNAAAHTVLTCEGQTVTPDLDSRAWRTLNAARATLPPQ